MPSGASIRGIVEQDRKIKNLARQFPERFAIAQFLETEIETEESRRRAPRKTGALASSIRTEGPEINGRSIKTAVTAGGPDAPYAIYVHENLFAHHPVGQAKFIESTLNESAPYMLRRIAARFYQTDW